MKASVQLVVLLCATASAAGSAACSSGEMHIEADSMAPQDHPLYALTKTYFNAEHRFKACLATLSCPDEATPDCLLRIEASDMVASGPTSSLILNLVIDAQALPGPVDMSAVLQGDLDEEPAIYAAIEEVSQEDVVLRYSFDCRFDAGTSSLFEKPVIGKPVHGQFDLDMTCTELLAPGEPFPAVLKGTFETIPKVSSS